MHRTLVNPAVTFFGRISYSLYFVHFAVLQFFYRQWHDGLPFAGPLVTPLAFLLLLGVSGALSWATWHRAGPPVGRVD